MYPLRVATWQTQFNQVGVGVDVGRQPAVYHRWAPVPGGIENIVVVLNFSDTDTFVDINFPLLGRWTDLLAGFTGGPGWSVDVAASPVPVPVGSHWGRVLRYFNPSP